MMLDADGLTCTRGSAIFAAVTELEVGEEGTSSRSWALNQDGRREHVEQRLADLRPRLFPGLTPADRPGRDEPK